MISELTVYATKLTDLLEALADAIEGLDEAQLNWRPPAPDMNSIYVIATHILGNAEAWVLGIACGQPIKRDRPAEFRAAGANAGPLVARARELARRIDDALAALPVSALDEGREPPAALRGVGPPQPLTARQAVMIAIEHAARHLGQIDITRDLALAN